MGDDKFWTAIFGELLNEDVIDNRIFYKLQDEIFLGMWAIVQDRVKNPPCTRISQGIS